MQRSPACPSSLGRSAPGNGPTKWHAKGHRGTLVARRSAPPPDGASSSTLSTRGTQRAGTVTESRVARWGNRTGCHFPSAQCNKTPEGPDGHGQCRICEAVLWRRCVCPSPQCHRRRTDFFHPGDRDRYPSGQRGQQLPPRGDDVNPRTGGGKRDALGPGTGLMTTHGRGTPPYGHRAPDGPPKPR